MKDKAQEYDQKVRDAADAVRIYEIPSHNVPVLEGKIKKIKSVPSRSVVLSSRSLITALSSAFIHKKQKHTQMASHTKFAPRLLTTKFR